MAPLLDLGTAAPPDPLAWAGGDELALGAFVRAALGLDDADVVSWRVRPVDHALVSPTTENLARVEGVALHRGVRRPWSLFVKVLRSWRHWPLFELMPAELRVRGLREWRFEAELYASDLGAALPAGMRLPRLHAVRELADDRLALWLEDVRTVPVPWDVARFERAAEGLARFSARLETVEHPLLTARRPLGTLTRLFHESRTVLVAAPMLSDDAVWSHPLITAAGDESLREDLVELAGRLPVLLDAAEQGPSLIVHGDACPQNLLVPIDDPDRFVVIDWSMPALDPAGAELAQLLIGLAHTGQVAVDELPRLRRTTVAAYAAGLAAEGVPVADDVVRFGCDLALVVRSAFTALPLERFDDLDRDGLARLVADRMALTRALVELGLALRPPG